MKTEPRTLPHDLDAEASVLGGILLWSAKTPVFARLDALDQRHFYDPRHGIVFAAMRRLDARAAPLDVVTVHAEIVAMGKGGVVGPALLGAVALCVPTPDNIVAYANIVIDKSLARSALLQMSELSEKLYGGTLTGEAIVVEVAELSASVSRDRPMNELINMSDVIKAVDIEIVAMVKDRREGRPIDFGTPTGMAAIDEFIAGIARGSTTVLAGRPKQGKSLVSDNWLEHAGEWAHVHRKGIALRLTNEDPPKQAGHRLLGSVTGIPTASIARGDLLDPYLYARYREGVERAKQTKVKTLRVNGMNGAQVAAKLRRIHAEHGVALVVWDYLQNAAWPEGARSPTEAVGRNMKLFVAAANELDIPNVVCSQITRPDRKDRERDHGYHTAEDFKQAGDIEENAKVAFILRDPWHFAKTESGATCYECNGKQPLRESCWACGGSAEVRQDPRTKALVYYSRLELHLVLNHQGKPGVTFVAHWDRPCHRVLGLCRWCKRAPLAPGVIECEACADVPMHIRMMGPATPQAVLPMDDVPPPTDDDLSHLGR